MLRIALVTEKRMFFVRQFSDLAIDRAGSSHKLLEASIVAILILDALAFIVTISSQSLKVEEEFTFWRSSVNLSFSYSFMYSVKIYHNVDAIKKFL